VTSIQRLFRWSKKEIFQSLGTLLNAGAIRTDVQIEGKDHRYYILVD
jgi:predicted RNA-binding protein (virulence factor B family)